MISNEIMTWLRSASKEDLDELIVTASKARNLLVQISFSAGDKVWFDAKTRGMIDGEIIKMNNKSCKVKSTTGMIWNVSPALLNKKV